jgi:hypothetical protein
MDEDSKSNAPEEAQELTPEELNKVSGGAGTPGSEISTEGHEKWIEVGSFSWGVNQ